MTQDADDARIGKLLHADAYMREITKSCVICVLRHGMYDMSTRIGARELARERLYDHVWYLRGGSYSGAPLCGRRQGQRCRVRCRGRGGGPLNVAVDARRRAGVCAAMGCQEGAVSIGSLFAGIGGLELGLEKGGLGPIVWQVEKDEYCRKILERHWPGAARFGDVRAIGAEQLEPVELICGGFPCQDLSYAGKGAGLGGSRSGLWSEFARIVRELRPRFVVVENVPALLARGMGRVLGDLAESGYDATWDCIPAASIGAHQERDRLLIVAYAVRGGCETGSPVQGDRDQRASGDLLQDQQNGHQPAQDMASIWVRARRQATTLTGPWPPEPGVDRMADGIPDHVARLRALGNAVVPQVAEVVGHVVRELKAAEEMQWTG